MRTDNYLAQCWGQLANPLVGNGIWLLLDHTYHRGYNSNWRITLIDPVAHAKAYPFPAPTFSYVFEMGRWSPLHHNTFDIVDRTPVLAAGSNQSPEQLARKYSNKLDIGPIPVIRGQLTNFDVVYAAHVAGYGSIPATFQSSPGTTVTVFVIWLTDFQLEIMHATEQNYNYDRLTGINLKIEFGPKPPEVFAYTAKVGCYNHKKSCLSLTEIPADNRKFASATQSEAQVFLRDKLSIGTDIDQFIAEQIADHSLRADRVAAMRVDAIKIGYKHETLLSL